MQRDLVYPIATSIDPPNDDLNGDIRELYSEAASICSASPKGAAALLRLALQMLMMQIGKDGKNLNANIKELVADGLSAKIQQALDLLRVIGNNAVHPGEISLDDNEDVALRMFRILNVIADELITKPKEIDQLYNELIPPETREHIQTRDKK